MHFSAYPAFCPYAYKKNGTVRSHDISINYDYLDPATEWYSVLKERTWNNVSRATDSIMYRWVGEWVRAVEIIVIIGPVYVLLKYMYMQQL